MNNPPISQGAEAVPSLYSHIAQSQDQDSASIPKPFKSAGGHGGKKIKVKKNNNSSLNHLPLPLNRKNSMKMEITTTTIRIIEVKIEAVDPIGANITVGGHKEGLSKGEGDSKIVIEANFKATVNSLTLLIVAITIITTVIIEAEVAVAMVVTFIDHVVMEEAIIGAITIIHTINITHMMMELSLNNMVHHELFAEVSIIFLNIVLRENMISIILLRK